jgi:hypothetical protein
LRFTVFDLVWTRLSVNVPQYGPITSACGINDAGQIVGYFNDASGSHGFLEITVSL